MKSFLKISFFCLILAVSFNGFAQSETYLQSFSNLYSINTSFAGYNKHSNFNTGNQFYYQNPNRGYNLFYATYDTYSEQLKGGIGFTFQQGLMTEKNTSTTELGLSYARFKVKTREGQITASFNANALIATKQWYAYILDQFLASDSDTPSAPGKKFTRYYILKPGGSFLFDIRNILFGVSANVPLYTSLSPDIENVHNPEQFPLNLSLYLAKSVGGNKRGLKSSPFKVSPELLFFYNEEYIMGRVHVKVEQINKSFGVFFQSDLSNKIYCLGGNFGYRFQNIRLNLNAGAGVPGISDEIGAIFELSLNMSVPQRNYSKIYPWAPKRK